MAAKVMPSITLLTLTLVALTSAVKLVTKVNYVPQKVLTLQPKVRTVAKPVVSVHKVYPKYVPKVHTVQKKFLSWHPVYPNLDSQHGHGAYHSGSSSYGLGSLGGLGGLGGHNALGGLGGHNTLGGHNAVGGLGGHNALGGLGGHNALGGLAAFQGGHAPHLGAAHGGFPGALPHPAAFTGYGHGGFGHGGLGLSGFGPLAGLGAFGPGLGAFGSQLGAFAPGLGAYGGFRSHHDHRDDHHHTHHHRHETRRTSTTSFSRGGTNARHGRFTGTGHY